MSAEATGFVFRHSPYKGAGFAVHLAIADSVNDQHGNQFWMSLGKLADKARLARPTVSACVQQMITDGWLVEVSRSAGSTVCYRFVFIPSDVVYESRWVSPEMTGGVTVDNRGVSSTVTGGVTLANPNPIEPKIEPNTNTANESFNEFWSLYPRKLTRNKARMAYLKALKTTDAETILVGLKWWIAGEWRGKEERYIPHAPTWLNQARWEDATTMPSTAFQKPLERPKYETDAIDRSGWVGEGKAFRGASEDVYLKHRASFHPDAWEWLDKGFYDL